MEVTLRGAMTAKPRRGSARPPQLPELGDSHFAVGKMRDNLQRATKRLGEVRLRKVARVAQLAKVYIVYSASARRTITS